MDPYARVNLDKNSLNNLSDIINAIHETDPSAHDIFQSNPYVIFTEQPTSEGLKFRYESEKKSCLIPGVRSTPENKTFPSIQICNCPRRAFKVIVSCVTTEKPHRPHPHKLGWKDVTNNGVCELEINDNAMTATFSHLGIKCVKNIDLKKSLSKRASIQVDPFGTGLTPSKIDIHSVRLCVQVFLESTDPKKPGFTIPLAPVVSNPIFDKEVMPDLIICKLNKYTSSCAGNEEIILFCERFRTDDTSVRFFKESRGKLVWERIVKLKESDVHKQVCIACHTPEYGSLKIKEPVKCFIQLKRLSNGATSEPLPFEYLPLDSDRRSSSSLGNGNTVLKQKRKQMDIDYIFGEDFLPPGDHLMQKPLLPETLNEIETFAPHYRNLASTSSTPPQQPSVPSTPNAILLSSLSPNFPIQNFIQNQPDGIQNVSLLASPIAAMQETNNFDQQCQSKAAIDQIHLNCITNDQNQNQLNHMALGSNTNLLDQLDTNTRQNQNQNQNALDSDTSMNISGLLDLVSHEEVSINDLSGLVRYIDGTLQIDNSEIYEAMSGSFSDLLINS